MNKKTVSTIVVLALLCVGGISAWLTMNSIPVSSPVAEIYSYGRLIRTVDLSHDDSFTVECDEGFNTILVKDGKISVTAADCPDKVCVRSEALPRGSVPIVCLPHRLEIQIRSASQDLDGQIR